MVSAAELSRIDRMIEVEAPPERVWRALTDAKELSAWFQVRIEGAIAPGAGGLDDVGPRAVCRPTVLYPVREMTPSRRFVWEWNPGAMDPNVDYSREPRTTVTFTLEASGAGTRLSVAGTDSDQISPARRAKVYEDNSQGWSEVLVWVRRHAEGAR